MDKNRKKQIKKYILWVSFVLVVILLAVMPLLASQNQPEDGPVASILTATVDTQDIETSIMGGGILIGEAAEKVTIPTTVKLTEYMVSNGDIVSKGDPIAKVDSVSVMDAISQVQEALTDLAKEIESERLEKANTIVKAQSAGTVKIVYAEKGDDAQDVMLEHGSLAVLSLDDKMAVDLKVNCKLAAGDTVQVTFSDGEEVDGKVESNLNGILVITIEDENYAPEETVTVATVDGKKLGAGKLYIHSPWNATAYAGSIASVRASVNQYVYDGSYLFTLEETGNTSLYHKLVAQRTEYEELMKQLFEIYDSEMLVAPCDGIVTGVDKNGAFMLSGMGEEGQICLLNAVNGNTNAEIVFLADESGDNSDDGSGGGSGDGSGDPGTVTPPPTPTTYSGWVCHVYQKGVDGLILRMNGATFTDISLNSIPGAMLDVSAMTISATYPSAEIYPMVYDATQGLIPGAAVNAGDILFFAVDGSDAPYVIWLGNSPVNSGGSSGGNSGGTQQPGTSGGQSGNNSSGIPGGSMAGLGGLTGGIPSGMGGIGAAGYAGMGAGAYGAMGGTGAEEEKYYSLETFTVASVTPQHEMTAKITIDETDISHIYNGQSVDVTVNALPGKNYSAVVTSIGNDGANQGGNSKYTVEITMTMEGDMLPGMTIAVKIPLSTSKEILSVPVEALYDQEGKTILYTSYNEEDGILENPVTVVTGSSDGSYAEIIAGIEQGTTVYYEFYDTVEFSNVPKAEFTF